MTAAALQLLRAEFLRCRDMDAALEVRLSAYSDAVRIHIPDYADAVDRLVARLFETGAGESSPRPGQAMPPFRLPDDAGRIVRLDQLLEKGPLAITFHRGHWCPWCRISAVALAEARDEIRSIGGDITAIMPERQKFAAEFKTQAGSPFPVLTDIDNGYALSVNLAIWIGPHLEELLQSYGFSLPDYQGNDAWLLPIPATFVVGQDGFEKARFVDPDFRHRVSIDMLIDALRSAA
jgi:peroxiredoxin